MHVGESRRMIHLDTNFLVAALPTGSAQEEQVRNWLGAGIPMAISTVAWAEFKCGPVSVRDEQIAKQMFANIEALTIADAECAAELFNQTGRRSRSLADCLIAAVALRCGAKLATVNISDFKCFVPHGLVLI
jgi:predicted nucleic acid-binding protein